MAIFTKHSIYKVVTPFVKGILSHSTTRNLVDNVITKHSIQYLEIGGAVPVEDYLVVHLSPVEIYGIPRKRNIGIHYNYDFANHAFQKETKQLSNAFTLNYNLMNGIPVSDNSMKGINMSHFLEHFTRMDGLKILRECKRILAPGGALRISCPDLRKYAAAYLSKDDDYFNHPLVSRFVNYEGLTSYGDLFIHKAYDGHNGHKWFYDAESAIKLCLEAGFKSGVEKKVHETSLPHVNTIEPLYREKESFYIEAYN
ncbi:class I SAM-dependent methyltransferase [Flavitalea sp.]|nr:methyltransferase domain-containing protein [Flavitalea sp.]